jgi:CO/xanthine dehydrogenase Mo-binding subunit
MSDGKGCEIARFQAPTPLANAFAHATGRRLRELPTTPERVKASLS